MEIVIGVNGFNLEKKNSEGDTDGGTTKRKATETGSHTPTRKKRKTDVIDLSTATKVTGFKEPKESKDFMLKLPGGYEISGRSMEQGKLLLEISPKDNSFSVEYDIKSKMLRVFRPENAGSGDIDHENQERNIPVGDENLARGVDKEVDSLGSVNKVGGNDPVVTPEKGKKDDN